MRNRIVMLVSAAVLLAAAPGAGVARSRLPHDLTPAAAGAGAFAKPVKLTGPAGGEPSIATDPFGDVFVVGPQGIPSGLNNEAGVGYWV